MAKKRDFLWWKHGVIYHIYTRSFSDSNNDGIGDLKGIIHKIQYLKDLGVQAIWLSPVYPSPHVDYGYDIMNYTAIDSQYGSLSDFRDLLHVAHQNGIKVIMDLVLNHTSNQHPWFLESSSSVNNPKRGWYIWNESSKGKTPNNWRSAFGGSAWEFHEPTNSWYLHSFFKEQPDLNWRNADMRREFFGDIEFWLEMGVDGFRLDVINMVGKDKKFRDNPPFFKLFSIKAMLFSRNRPRSYKVIHRLRKLVDKYPDRVLIGEIYTPPPGNSELVASFLGDGTESLNLAFDFTLFFKRWDAAKYYKSIYNQYNTLHRNAWPSFVFSNHDLSRGINRFGRNGEQKARLAALLLLTLRGTPFIYYGDEIGMVNVNLKKDDLTDPLGKKFWPFYKGRDRSRTPMQWSSYVNAGFSYNKPWLPVHANHTYCNVETQTDDEVSLLSLYKFLIKLRNSSIALQKGSWEPLVEGQNQILAYFRSYEKERLLILVNFGNKPRNIPLPRGRFEYIFDSNSLVSNGFCMASIDIQPLQGFILKELPFNY
jgi:alpha-glucosidase